MVGVFPPPPAPNQGLIKSDKGPREMVQWMAVPREPLSCTCNPSCCEGGDERGSLELGGCQPQCSERPQCKEMRQTDKAGSQCCPLDSAHMMGPWTCTHMCTYTTHAYHNRRENGSYPHHQDAGIMPRPLQLCWGEECLFFVPGLHVHSSDELCMCSECTSHFK